MPCKKKYCSNMAILKCKNCESEYLYRAKYGNKCPVCDTIREARISVEAPEKLKESLIEQARDQAKVVNKFGEVLQVIGYVIISIFSIFLFIFLYSRYWVGVFASLIAILLTFVSYNVFGSAIRAVALYIQVKVK